MSFIQSIKKHKVTFFMGLIPLCLALAIYLYMDFSPRVDSTLSGPGLVLSYAMGFLGFIGIVGILMGSKIDSNNR